MARFGGIGRSRIGKTFWFGGSQFLFMLVVHKNYWAVSLHILKRVVWVRPIRYDLL